MRGTQSEFQSPQPMPLSEWVPEPFNLLDGNPFEYSEHAISSTSGTEAFRTGIQEEVDTLRYEITVLLYQELIIAQWAKAGFVPPGAKSVESEARNGLLLCKNHLGLFDSYSNYIRWVPEARRFVFINHSQSRHLEAFHGKAIDLDEKNDRLPFHMSFP